jgi:hypothetical protein
MQEITLRMSLARALMATKGYSREVEEAYATALQPFQGRELPQLFPVLRSLASYYIAQSEFDKGARIGREILQLAERQNDDGMGPAKEGLAQVDEGIALYQELKTPPVFWPSLLAIKAGAHALAGRVAEGLVLVDEALELAASRDPSSIPELSLLKGDMLTAAGVADADAAHWFHKAFDGAGDQGAGMTQLRAALRLCRLWRSQGADDADRLLRGVYDTFTEGFATADLVEARTLLERLPPSSTR